MKKKGFTLVELLAVIIILGLLAVLIIPKVLTSLNEAESKSHLTSAKNLVKTAELKSANNQLTGNNDLIMVDYTNDINVDSIEYNGSKPTAGQIKVTNSGRVEMAVKIGDNCYKKSYNSDDITTEEYNISTCKVSKGFVPKKQQQIGQLSVGDEVEIGTEDFYVIESNSTTTKLLAKYNLYVGSIYEDSTKIRDITSSETGYGLQSSNAKGYVPGEQAIGTVAFAGSKYWWGETLNPTYGTTALESDIYDQNYDSATGDNYSLAYYIKPYVNTLKQLGADATTQGRLLTYEEYYNLTTSNITPLCNGTTFWLGSVSQDTLIDKISSSTCPGIATSGYTLESDVGVRPLIIVPTNNIEY